MAGGKTEAQKVVDFVMARYAKFKGHVLPEKYWSDPLYETEYIRQIRKAHSLVKLYSKEAIIEALEQKHNTWMYSLYTKKLIDCIRTIHKKNKRAENAKSVKMEVDEEVEYKPKNKKGSKLDEL